MFNLIGTTVSTEPMSAVLRDFAREVGAGPARQVVVVLDDVGGHTSPGLVLPAGIHLVHLPACSPELQPVERLSPLVTEALASRPSTTIDQLVATLTTRLAAWRPKVGPQGLERREMAAWRPKVGPQRLERREMAA